VSFQLLFTEECFFKVPKNFVRTGRQVEERSYQRQQQQKGKQPAQPSVRLYLGGGVSEASGLSEQPQKNSMNLMQSSSPAQTYSASSDCVRNVAAFIFFRQFFIQVLFSGRRVIQHESIRRHDDHRHLLLSAVPCPHLMHTDSAGGPCPNPSSVIEQLCSDSNGNRVTPVAYQQKLHPDGHTCKLTVVISSVFPSRGR